MHKIFCTPELLDEILSDLSEYTLTVAARVCKLWFTHSIQLLWKFVNLDDILGVLSPFDADGFQQPLLSESWRRFFLYSKNIRTLGCYEIECSALRQALLWRPNGDLLFPELTVLCWDGPLKSIEYLPFLVTSTLQILQVQLDTIKNLNMLDIFCKTIPLRSPSLRAFGLSLPPASTDIQAISRSLGELFPLLSELVLISLPPHSVTEELFTILSRLARLRGLSLFKYLHGLYMDEDILEELPKQKIDDDEEARKDIPFRSLQQIELSDSDFMTGEVLRRGIQLLKLVDLTYSGSQTLNRVITLTGSLHRICPNLEKISIFAGGSLPFQAIRSLLKCPALIEIVSNGTVNMDLEDITTIASNRSSWQVIVLPSVKPLSYQALVPFAQNCPDLYQLGLTLDSKLGIPDFDAFTTDVKFSSLTSLNIMFSVTPDFELALLLSKICSKPIKIGGHITEKNSHLWETVEKLVNLIITTQLENQTLKDTVALLGGNYECNNHF